MIEKDFISICNAVAKECHEQSCKSGFWNPDRNGAEAIALMHSELSEALEAMRHGNPSSDHIPDFSGAEEEFADCIIRIMDLAYGRKWRVADAILAKMKFNASRERKHGKNF
jgi:NTP pyrophosphatase (non-canonical NTP hydrolase)